MELFSGDSAPTTLSLSGKALAGKLKDKTAVIGIAGLGYVGLPIALEYALKGFSVVGVDVSSEKVEMLNRGENYIEDLDNAEIKKVWEQGLLTAHTDFAPLAKADVIFICVPTPFNTNKDPDLTYILSSGKEVSKHLKAGQLIILKSTTFPGTTEDYLIPELERSGLKAGEDFFVSFSPERVDPGNQDFHTGNTPIVVGGTTEESTYLCALANNQIIQNVYTVSNPRIAELEKLLENIFRSVNIALVNELALLAERMPGINIWEVIEAASTKPFGFMKFTPGPGIGGHCIPVDPYYLSWLARAYDFETRFITLSANTNESMPYHVANKIVKVIAGQPVSLGQARVLVVGVAFKKNVKDLRNSPAEPIIRNLRDAGITKIDVTDPWVPEYRANGETFLSIDISAEMLASYNCVVIVTDHDEFDMNFVVEHARAVVDTRNATQKVSENRDKIVLLGSSI